MKRDLYQTRYDSCVTNGATDMTLEEYIALKEGTSGDRQAIEIEAAEVGVRDSLRSLKSNSSTFATLAWFCTDVLLICLAFYVASLSLWLWLPAMLLLASRLRALGNLLHDASHGNALSSRKFNDLLGRFILAPATFEGWNTYRDTHKEHHSELGSPCDPDIVQTNFESSHGWKRFSCAFVRNLTAPEFWRGSVIAGTARLKRGDRIPLMVFWGSIAVLTMFLFGLTAVISGVMLFLLTRTTLYHFLRVFWEMADHAFLEPKSEIEFTRTLPSSSPLTWLLHPHHDNFHLAHHLYPTIPLCKLPAAHKLLLRCPTYARAEICDGYLIGRKTVLKSFTGHRYRKA